MEALILDFKTKTVPCQKEYNRVISMAAQLLNLTPEKKEKMRTNIISQIIGKLPFLAKCNNPERIALSHIIITYAASHYVSKETFLHNITDNDDLFSRLECINQFEGGDPKVIKSGMNLLALLMLSDHNHDRELDLIKNKYNPLNSGVWDYNELSKQLLNEINELACLEMNYLPGVSDVRQGVWEYP
jgi:hypothetical protein